MNAKRLLYAIARRDCCIFFSSCATFEAKWNFGIFECITFRNVVCHLFQSMSTITSLGSMNFVCFFFWLCRCVARVMVYCVFMYIFVYAHCTCDVYTVDCTVFISVSRKGITIGHKMASTLMNETPGILCSVYSLLFRQYVVRFYFHFYV